MSDTNQIILLKQLAKRIKAEKRSREKIIATLQSAKILTKSEKFTRHYSHLEEYINASE